MRNKFLLFTLILQTLFVFTACNTAENPEQQIVFEMENRLCRRWLCQTITFGTTDNNLNNPVFFTFMDDGRLFVEREGNSDVDIYNWSKISDDEIQMLITTPTADLKDILNNYPIFSLLPLFEIDDNMFVDTLNLTAHIDDLTDNMLVLSSEIMLKDILNDEAIERLGIYGITTNVITSAIKYTLHFRRD